MLHGSILLQYQTSSKKRWGGVVHPLLASRTIVYTIPPHADKGLRLAQRLKLVPSGDIKAGIEHGTGFLLALACYEASHPPAQMVR